MPAYVDQLNRSVQIVSPPQRIISLVPSQTELLFDLGLGDRVVGVTKFCIHPATAIKEKTIVGGTKKFRFDVMDQLKPDLIIGNKEENYREGIAQLEKKYPVWMSDVSDFKSALMMIEGIASVAGVMETGSQLTTSIKKEFKELHRFPARRVLYLIWYPWMAAGTTTFINDMLSRLGLENVITETRYPELTDATIQKLNPEIMLLSSEPFPFNASHEEQLRKLLPQAKIVHIDGEPFSWYGSRMLKAPEYFRTLNF